jgi:hypothetical protein
MKLFFRAAAAAALCAASACFAQDIPRQAAEKFVVGTTQRKQVVDEYGVPKRQGQTLKNGKMVWTLSYTHAEAGGKAHNPGVTPARAHTFYFLNDLLVGYEFISSWENDHTNFEDRKVEEIVKDKSTREEVVRIMGRPGGQLTFPMINATTGDALMWAYVEVKRSGFASFTMSRKLLIVTFDTNNVAVDVAYTASSN